MRRRAAALLLALPFLAGAAGGVEIKLATLVPEGSVWDKTLREMGAEWERATAGRVGLRIYPGGVAGNEDSVVRKMRIGQLHAGALTVAGLADIDDSFKVFQIPMLFRSYDELYHVVDRLTPELAGRLEERGFVLLNWGHAGWVHLFTKEPVTTVEELKRVKIFVPAGDDRMVRWWKDNGFRPVALAFSDVLTGLQTGMIEAYPTTPLAALTLQWYRLTPYMPDIGLAPLVGAVVLTERAWRQIPEGDRPAIRAAARRAGERLAEQIPDQDRRAVAAMEERGLKVLEVKGTPKEADWRAAAESFTRSVRSSMGSTEVLDLAAREMEAFRGPDP